MIIDKTIENVQHGKQQRPLWKVWKTAKKLEERQDDFYPTITKKVVHILRDWGSTWEGQPGWKGFLDKHSLLHETEESIIAIYHLLQRRRVQSKCETKYIVVDVCGGKGLFSFLLSYFKPPNVDQIILLEKADIDWYHIHEANRSAKEQGRPIISIWDNTNLHDYDVVLDRMLNLPYPVAMTGIHLCKQLSPAFCGLVNGLGSQRCIYACLVPCCMPQAITGQKKHPTKCFTIPIRLEESIKERQSRREYMERRERLKRKPTAGPCFLCHHESHNLQECPVLPTLSKEKQISIRRAWHTATIPCWNCMEYGHYKSDCPQASNSSNRSSRQPPVVCIDVSNVLQAPCPYSSYCKLLAKGLQHRQSQVIETELENQKKHQEGNWNSGRKAIFILVQ